MSKFQFGNIVVVSNGQIGVILKTWAPLGGYQYDVYVRSRNAISEYKESDIKHYVYSKEILDEQTDFYPNP